MSRILITAAPHRMETRERDLPAPGPGQILVKASCSAISAGTEGLVFRGEMPAGIRLDTAIPDFAAPFAYPVAYGYALVGTVAAEGPAPAAEPPLPSLLGRRVFCYAPHGEHAVQQRSAVIPLPDALSDEDAVFLASMETALSLAHDGSVRAGERVAVIGLGTVGLLTCGLASPPFGVLHGLDRSGRRRDAAAGLGADTGLPPEGSLDAVFELSGNPEALNQAIRLTGFGGRVIMGSWYGTKPLALDLGGDFHRSRMTLVSSQVSTLNPALSGRWSKARRIETALRALETLRPGRWISHRFSLDQAQQAFELACRHPDDCLQVVFSY